MQKLRDFLVAFAALAVGTIGSSIFNSTVGKNFTNGEILITYGAGIVAALAIWGVVTVIGNRRAAAKHKARRATDVEAGLRAMQETRPPQN